MKLSDLGLLEFVDYVVHLEACKDTLKDVHKQLETTGQVDDYTRARIQALIETKG